MGAILEWLDKNAKGMLTLSILLLTITVILIVFTLFITKKAINLSPIGFVDSPQLVICSNMPIGMIIPYAGNFSKKNLENLDKSGWLPCNGSSKEDKLYPELSTLIKDKYGIGATSNEFRLPNLDGRFMRGSNKDTPLGKTGGQDFLEKIPLPDHDHYLGDRTNSITNWGSDPGRHPYKARDDHDTKWRESHLRNDGGTSSEGQHYHSLRGLKTVLNKDLEKSQKKKVYIDKIDTIPSFVSLNFIIRAK